MGILNATPDSFSDGGKDANIEATIARGLKMVEDGADVVDIGGESTRPGATPVPEAEELRRVIPVVEALAKRTTAWLSIDTMKASVARAALAAGATIVNDVSGLRDPAMVEVCVKAQAAVVVMHMQGVPQTMQDQPHYTDVVAEVKSFFETRIQDLTAAGLPRNAICLDPGIGFGKTTAHNLALLANLEAFQTFGRPVCLGVSRKKFAGELCRRGTENRLAASLAVASFAMARRSAHIFRVHDVPETRDAAILAEAIHGGTP
jgi:dihydropteroate synthase